MASNIAKFDEAFDKLSISFDNLKLLSSDTANIDKNNTKNNLSSALDDELSSASNDKISSALDDKISSTLDDELPSASNDKISSALDDKISPPLNNVFSLVSKEKYQFKVIDKLPDAYLVIELLLKEHTLTIDFEGVDLGRVGELTVIGIGTIDAYSIAYLFDICLLGKSFLRADKNGLKTILESNSIRKISFDCRTDSDALYHQFDVKLTNVIDLQVYDQGIKRHLKKYTDYRPTFVKGLKAISSEYISSMDINTLSFEAPHKADMKIWKKRPLTNEQWSYASADIHLIRILYLMMIQVCIPAFMLARIEAGSMKYLNKFRSYKDDVNINFRKHKYFIMRAANI